MKGNKKLNQAVAGTLAASILTGSCTQYPYINEDRIYGNIVIDDLDLGELAIPISLKIKPEDALYINAIQQVMVDMLNSPQKASEFKENPSFYLKKYGYNGKVNLDDNLLKITMALSDKDISQAIEKQDFTTFMKLCKERDLISSSKGIFSDAYYEEQINKIYEREDIKKLSESLLRSGELDAKSGKTFFLPVIAVIAAAAVVLVGIWAYAVFHVYLVTRVGVYTKGVSMMPEIRDFSIIDVYEIKNGMENTYIAVDNYTEEIVNDAIRAIKEAQPDFFNENSEEEVRNLLKINILNNIRNI